MYSRRHFTKTTLTSLAASLTASTSASPEASAAPEERVSAETRDLVEVGAPGRLIPYQKTGQPFQLAGKRMVFTGYHYIRPARFGWYDNRDNIVNTRDTANLGDAHLKTFDAPTGIRIVAQPAQRSDRPYPLESIKPWERDGVQLCSFIQNEHGNIQWTGSMLFDDEDGYFKAWGTCKSRGTSYRCYLQSRDFKTWERPNLGLIEFEGSKKNNLFQVEKENLFGYVFKDPSSREERWKWMLEGETTLEQFDQYRKKRPHAWDPDALLITNYRAQPRWVFAVRGGFSADGFRWTTIPEPLVVEDSDVLHAAFYDVQLKRYVAYFRHREMPKGYSTRPRSDYLSDWERGVPQKISQSLGRRSIGRSETDDFRRFPMSELIMEPGPDNVGPSDTFYTNCHTLVPGAKDQHLFFPTIWNQMYDNTSVGAIASSDGKILHWLPGSPVLDTASFGQWDGGCIFAQPDLMELPDGRWVLPYFGFNVPHKYPRKGAFKHGLGFASWPKGRLVAVEAPEQGQFITFAFMPPGRKIRLNALTPLGGCILVEVADLMGKTVPGRSFGDCNPIIGDQYKALVSWKGSTDIGVGDNMPISLRFKMANAKLFFVDFEV